MRKGIFIITTLTALTLCLSLTKNQNELEKYHLDDVEDITYSIDPPPQRTGAPGEDDCTQCHSGSVFSAGGVIDYSFSGVLNQYLPDSTYDISLSVPSNVVNGFEMTILDGNTFQAGSFTAGSGTSVVQSGLREYIRQTVPNMTSWTFQWTAPSSDVGNLTAYYAFNKSNNSGTTFGDSIFLGQETIFVSAQAGLTENNTDDSQVNLYYNSINNHFNIRLLLKRPAKVSISVFSLSGQRVYYSNWGLMAPNNYDEYFKINEFYLQPFYVVNVKIGENNFSQKVYIP